MYPRVLFATMAAIRIMTVHGQCTADFDLSANWDTVTFTNLSSVSNARYYWNFGDGSTSYETSPVHVFIEAGTFQVTLHAMDTVSQCHSFHQSWIPVSRPMNEVCEPYMTDTIYSYNGSDYAVVTDGAIGCYGMGRYVDCMGAQNWQPGVAIGFGNWGHALTMARLRYMSFDSINGALFRRAYYRTIPYNHDPGTRYDTCSADFEYFLEYLPEGAVGTFRPLGPPGADTIWVTGYGNPIPLVGSVSTFTFPYYGGPMGHWKNIYRRNRDQTHGCDNQQAHTLIIRDPYYIPPPSCRIDPQPQDALVFEDGTAQFIINTDSGANRQWQQNAGLGWQDLYDAGPYSGVNTDTLTVTNCQSWWSNYQYRCVVTAPGSSCHNTSSVAVLSVVVGIDEAVNSDFRVFPIPAMDHLNLVSANPHGTHDLIIMDAIGSPVMRSTMSGIPSFLDIATLAPGPYLICIRSQNRLSTARFIKL